MISERSLRLTRAPLRVARPRARVAVRAAASRRGDRLIADGERMLFKHPRTDRYVVVYSVSLPATNMGIVFRDAGVGAPVVLELAPGGYADKNTDIAPGDKLLRCTAYEIDVEHPNLAPKSFVFDCVANAPDGKPPSFETCMRALNSTEIHSAGFMHRCVTCEFLRDVHDALARDEHERFMRRIAAVGRLETDREAAERAGARFPPRAPGERVDGSTDPLYVPNVYPVDD